MIKVITDRFNNLEYDVRGIAMSFYPGEDINFLREDDALKKDAQEKEVQTIAAHEKGAQEEEVQTIAAHKKDAQENDGEGSADHVFDLEKIFVDADDGTTKNELRKKLYRYLKAETGRTLPWGILIGIRPTKLTRQFLENELKGEEAASEFVDATSSKTGDAVSSELIVKAAKWMQDEYLVSPEKSVLASIIAARELQVLSKKGMAAQKSAATQKGVAAQKGAAQKGAHTNRMQPKAERIGFSLYIGIPFCPSRCSYCSFASQPAALWQGSMNKYVDALIKELEAVNKMLGGENHNAANNDGNEFCENRKLYTCNSIYIGGGTPTTLPDEEFERLLKKVRELFVVDATSSIDAVNSTDEATHADAASSIDAISSTDAEKHTVTNNAIEFTVEAGRPDTITKEKLDIMKRYGVNRISINPQSMNEKTLEAIGRNHKVSDIIEAFTMARDAGFDNINMDMILGLPGESADDVKKTLAEIKKLKPDSLTVHALAVKRAARLNLESEHAVMPGRGEEESKQMMDAAAFAAGEMGLAPYYMYRQKNMAGNLENVGYAAPGKECYYNIVMMEETESIIACGAGTVSKRVTNQQPSGIETNVVTKQTSSKEAKPTQPITRCDTHKDPKLYIEQIDEMIARKRRLFA